MACLIDNLLTLYSIQRSSMFVACDANSNIGHTHVFKHWGVTRRMPPVGKKLPAIPEHMGLPKVFN